MPATPHWPFTSKRRQAACRAIRNSDTRKKPFSKRLSRARAGPSPTVRPRMVKVSLQEA